VTVSETYAIVLGRFYEQLAERLLAYQRRDDVEANESATKPVNSGWQDSLLPQWRPNGNLKARFEHLKQYYQHDFAPAPGP